MRRLVISAFTSIGLLLQGASASAETVIEIQVTSDPANQFDPAIRNGRVAYTDFRNGDADIYVYDLDTGTETRIGTTGTHQVLEDIDGDVVVFTDYRDGNGDIYAYDLATGLETRVTTDPADQQNPAISGTRTVWEDFRTGTSTPNVFVGSIQGGTETAVSANAAPQLQPAIHGDVVAWEDLRNAGAGSGYDLFAYDLAAGAQITVATGAGNARRPDVDMGRIVFQDDVHGNLDVFLYDVASGTTTRLTSDPATQQNAHISGDRVVWEDFRNGNWDLYGMDLATMTEVAIATGASNQFLHDIDGNDIAFTDDRNGNQDIYVLRVVQDPTPAPGSGDPCDPASGAPVYFEETFSRAAGEPVTETRTVVAPAGVGEGTVCITGESVTAAWIGFDEAELWGPSDFHNGSMQDAAAVALASSHELTVRLGGKPCKLDDACEDDDGVDRPSRFDGDDDGDDDGGEDGEGDDEGDDGDDDGDDPDGRERCATLNLRVVGPVPAVSASANPANGLSAASCSVSSQSESSLVYPLLSLIALATLLVRKRERGGATAGARIRPFR